MDACLSMWVCACLYVGVCIFYLVMEFVIIAVSVRCIVRNYVYKSAAMKGRELLMLAIPPLMATAGYVVICCYRWFYLSECEKLPGFYDSLSLIYYFAALIMIVVVIVLYQKIKAGQEEKLQKELEEIKSLLQQRNETEATTLQKEETQTSIAEPEMPKIPSDNTEDSTT